MNAELMQRGDGEFSTTLLAMAGHDLRQPLQIIANAHEVLGASLHNQHQRAALARAEFAAKKLTEMLGQLVEAVHLGTSRNRALVPVALAPILEELVAQFAEPARDRGITLRVMATGTALSHPVLLTGMVRNLIRNAIEYTPPGGRVLVAARRRGPELHIQVRDNGIGIHHAALSEIFEAFRRVNEFRPEGLGLGLFIVKRAADLLGHRVQVRSAEGCGSCFTVVTEGLWH